MLTRTSPIDLLKTKRGESCAALFGAEARLPSLQPVAASATMTPSPAVESASRLLNTAPRNPRRSSGRSLPRTADPLPALRPDALHERAEEGEECDSEEWIRREPVAQGPLPLGAIGTLARDERGRPDVHVIGAEDPVAPEFREDEAHDVLAVGIRHHRASARTGQRKPSDLLLESGRNLPHSQPVQDRSRTRPQLPDDRPDPAAAVAGPVVQKPDEVYALTAA